MPPVRLKPAILAGERPQTYALDRAATGIGVMTFELSLFKGLTCYSVGIIRMRDMCKLYCRLGLAV